MVAVASSHLSAWDWFKMALGTGIFGVWAYLLVTEHGQIDYLVHVAMLAVVGACFGSPLKVLGEILRGKEDGKP